jgi:hypothetical protein
MSFSASTCLTYTGTTPLGGFITIYSNVSGIPLQVGVPLADITGPNCPYIIEVPDGTTSLTLVDIPTYCEVQIPVISSDFCVTCDLNFDIPLSGTVGVLSVGNLTGSCENPITDYLFTWYGPNSLSTSAFTSAPSYSSYPHQFNHPLTGTSQPPVLAGTYTPILEKIVISGYTFTPTVQNGTIVANLDCFGDVTVSPYDCSNGGVYNLTNSQSGYAVPYDHRLNYVTDYFNQPQPLSATFVLSSNTNYFPFAFKGDSIVDTLKITYSGANYPQPYILEYVEVGSNLTNSSINLRLNIMPKSADTSDYYRRVLCFTGFTNKQDGDLLILNITPNTGNTNWDFYFGCLETFDCSSCLDNYQNQSYKISASTITATTLDGLSTNIQFAVSGCSFNGNNPNTVTKTDFYNYVNVSNDGAYLVTGTIPYNFSPYTLRERTSSDLFFPGTYSTTCSRVVLPSDPAPSTGLTCTQNTGKLIKFTKTIGNIFMEFQDQSDFLAYYNSYLNIMQYSGTPTNSLDVNYYRMMNLSVPTATTNQQCGDGFSYVSYFIHPSSVVTTGTTGTGYTFNLTMPTITNDLGNYNGYNCKLWFDDIVSRVFNSSQGSNVTYSNSNGVRRTTPFIQMFTVNSTGTPPVASTTATTMFGNVTLWPYEYTTYAYSSTSANSLLTTFSAVTCNNFSQIDSVGNNARINPYYFDIRLTNPLDVNDFQIWASPINNFAYSGYPTNTIYYELAYDYSGGNVIYSSSTYIME